MSPPALLCALGGLVSLDMRIIAPILPAIAAALGVTAGEVGHAVTGDTLAHGVTQVACGQLSDRCGRIRVARTAALLFAAGTALGGLGRFAPVFVSARLATGAFAAAVIPTTFAYIGDTVPYAGRQRTIALFGTVMSAAQAMSMTVAGAVTHVVSWRVMFGAYALITLVPVPRRRPGLRGARTARRRRPDAGGGRPLRRGPGRRRPARRPPRLKSSAATT